MKTIKELKEKYDLELDIVVANVKKQKAKILLLQFPDGLKQYAIVVVDYLREKCEGVEFLIWFGSCYGACDVPVLGEELNKEIDLVVQFGHNEVISQ